MSELTKEREFEIRGMYLEHGYAYRPTGDTIGELLSEIDRLRSREAKLLGVVGKLQSELKYFVDRVEGNHPDGRIQSRTTYTRYKKAIASVSAEMEIEG